MDNKAVVVTIDGPGGAGKGTVSRLLAKQLGWHLLESGALYRLLALCAQKHQVAFDDIAGLTALAEALDVQFVQDAEIDATQYLLEGQNVSDQIMHETCGEAASQISVFLSVRQALLARQRNFRESPGLIAEGRDMGTVIFPEAILKIFLSASHEARAQRRYNQLKQQGIHVNLDALQTEIMLRDKRDQERVASPLVPAFDAILLDTTDMDIPAVIERITWLLNQRLYQ